MPAPPSTSQRLVLDWDGTCTLHDGVVAVVTRFGDPEVYLAAEKGLGRRLTLHEVIGMELATITVPLAEAVDFLVAEVPLRPGFAELAARHRPLILSSGFIELIEPLLAREGVAGLEVAANRLEAAGARLAQLEESTTKLLSDVEDADMAKTLVAFSTQQAVYQAALRAGANIVQASLLDFLR